MKRIVIIIIIFFSTILIYPDDIRQVTSDIGLRIREFPDINSKIIGRLNYEQVVTVIKIDSSEYEIEDFLGHWVYIVTDNISGWVFDGYLDTMYFDIWQFNNNNIIRHAQKYHSLPVDGFLNTEKNYKNREYKYISGSKMAYYEENIELGVKAKIELVIEDNVLCVIKITYYTQDNKLFFDKLLKTLNKYNLNTYRVDSNWYMWELYTEEGRFSFQLMLYENYVLLELGAAG
jgi:hypothetical protein